MLEAEVEAASPVAAPAHKVARVLRDLETYVSGQSELIIDMRLPDVVMNRSRRRLPGARCNGCCTGG
jgi:hypothetical protein